MMLKWRCGTFAEMSGISEMMSNEGHRQDNSAVLADSTDQHAAKADWTPVFNVTDSYRRLVATRAGRGFVAKSGPTIVCQLQLCLQAPSTPPVGLWTWSNNSTAMKCLSHNPNSTGGRLHCCRVATNWSHFVYSKYHKLLPSEPCNLPAEPSKIKHKHKCQ